MKLVECVPNFSEGRRPEVIDEIVGAMVAVPGVRLLDKEMDPNHNRAVVTIVGEPEPVLEGAFRGVAKAAVLIDLRPHKGEHPRMGAADVSRSSRSAGSRCRTAWPSPGGSGSAWGPSSAFPSTCTSARRPGPAGRTWPTCARASSRGCAARSARTRSAIRTSGRRRSTRRPERSRSSARGRSSWPTTSTSCTHLIVAVAKAIAKAIRHSTGGLRYVKAMGFELKDRGIVQVSINMVNFEGTPLFRVFELVRVEAERHGVPVVGSEIVGLVPEDALIACAEFYLRLESFKRDQILEYRFSESEGT